MKFWFEVPIRPGLRLVLGLLLGLACATAHPRSFSELGRGRGLEAGMAVAMVFDGDGFLWVGSREGLYRYDGYEARVFRPDPADPASISDGDIRALHVARNRSLWIGTNAGGLNRYDRASGRFVTYRHDPANPASLGDDLVYGIAEDDQGRIWATTRKGASRLDPANGTIERFAHDPSNPASLSSDWAFAAHRGPSGTLWISTVGGGINRWDAKRDEFVRVDLAALTGGTAARNEAFVMHEQDGRLWVGTRDGLAVLDVVAGTARLVDLGTRNGLRPIITSMHADERGRLWLGTMVEGVLVVDMKTGAWEAAHPSSIGAPGNLPAQPQISLAGYGGMLFVGTWGNGVYRAPLDDPGFLLIGTAGGSGLRNKDITAVLATEAAGRPWIGSFGAGPQRADVVRRTVEPGAPAADDRIRTAGVLHLARDSAGTLYAGTTQGLYAFNEDGRSRWLDEIDRQDSGGLGRGYVTGLLAGPAGAIWVGQAGGGLRRREASGAYASFLQQPEDPASLPSDDITALEALDGDLWVGTATAGLSRCRLRPWSCARVFADDTGASSLGSRHVTQLYRDRADRLWVATDGGGVTQLARDWRGREPSAMRRWTVDDGLLSDSVMGIAEDADGTLWLSSRQGLSRLNAATGAVVNHVYQSGLPASEFNARAAAADESFVYFGSFEGLLAVSKGTEFEPRPRAPLRITSLERLARGAAGRDLPGTAGNLRMAHDEALSVRFAVLDYAEVPHEYEYRLGPQDEWTSIGQRRDLLFANLAPGHHQLELRGRDVFGQWSASPPLEIEVVPPFWMTPWFRIALAATLLLLVLGVHRARLGVLERRNVELEGLKNQREEALVRAEASQRQLSEAYDDLRSLTQRLESAKEEERLAISRELHDELGQSLTAAKLNLQILGRQAGVELRQTRLDDTVAMLDGMIRQVRQISLTLRPPMLDEAGLVPALEYYLDTVAERSGVDIRFEADARLPGRDTSDMRVTVFRVVQEAVNNALRHAGANHIVVRLRSSDDGMLVEVEDDGVGFDPQAVRERVRRGQHLGLLGMAERVHASGGRFSIDARPGSGSRIEAWIPCGHQAPEGAT